MMRRNPPLRIVVVDDDPETAHELAELLEAHGAVTTVATTPQQALAVAVEPLDVALIDLELGGASGVDLALRWHGMKSAPAVILLSGRNLTGSEAARFQTIPLLLRKPLDLAQLRAAIIRIRS